ncbi:MAG: hypothetical protein ACR2LP_03180, partial [Candidatus Limnocylindrales bacterium]
MSADPSPIEPPCPGLTAARRDSRPGLTAARRDSHRRSVRQPATPLRTMRMSDVLRQLRQQHQAAGARPRLLERFAAFLPVDDSTPLISLGEGFTPLIHARTLGRIIGCPLLHLKIEGQN